MAGVFGVRGELRLHLHHRESTLLSKGHPVVLVDDQGRRWATTLKAREGAGRRVLGTLGVTVQREQATELIGWRILVPSTDLPPLDEGEFWVWQVIGADVVIDDAVVGKVTDVHSTGPVDIFEVAVEGRREPAFVPSLSEFIVSVSPGRLTVLAGALTDDDAPDTP